MKVLLVPICVILFLIQAFAQCNELKPMYGENCVKTALQKKADEQFITAQAKKYGSPDSAARVLVREAWRSFEKEAPDQAMKQLNQAWLLNNQLPEVYFLFGHVSRYSLNKNAAEADKYYELGRLRDANKKAEPRSLVKLLTLMQDQHNLSGAIDASTQLVVSYPTYRQGYGYKQRAYLYTQAQLLDRALEDAEMALKIDPKDPEVYVARGFARSWKGDQQAALADYNKALAVNPTFSSAYRHRAMLYADKLNQPELALPDIEKAIALNPEQLHNFKVKSDILFTLNRKADACSNLKIATKSGEKSIQEEYVAKCGK